jgi:hypothetical protein
MDALGALGAAGGSVGALGRHLAELVAEAPDDPVLLVGAVLLAWLPLCAVVLGGLTVVARLQVYLVHRQRPRLSLSLPPQERRPLVTRRFITNPRRTNGFLATARLALAVCIVVGFTALVLASSAPLLLSSFRG